MIYVCVMETTETTTMDRQSVDSVIMLHKHRRGWLGADGEAKDGTENAADDSDDVAI